MSPGFALPEDEGAWAMALSEDPDALAGIMREIVLIADDVEPTAEGLHGLLYPEEG